MTDDINHLRALCAQLKDENEGLKVELFNEREKRKIANEKCLHNYNCVIDCDEARDMCDVSMAIGRWRRGLRERGWGE